MPHFIRMQNSVDIYPIYLIHFLIKVNIRGKNINIINYILKKKKVYVGTTAIVFIFGSVLVLWGIDVNQNQIKNTILVFVGTSLIAGGITAVLDLFKNINNDKTELSFKPGLRMSIKSVIWMSMMN